MRLSEARAALEYLRRAQVARARGVGAISVDLTEGEMALATADAPMTREQSYLAYFIRLQEMRAAERAARRAVPTDPTDYAAVMAYQAAIEQDAEADEWSSRLIELLMEQEGLRQKAESELAQSMVGAQVHAETQATKRMKAGSSPMAMFTAPWQALSSIGSSMGKRK